ncbi:MAG: carboxypeptidase-like regulatory domain-containing protein [Flavobacteriales bacterium]|nr:carboxypeptidase-like regulatory domain-containing protein [Flavobacteriales bacterium]
MSDIAWHYINNQFDQATRNSFKRCNILNNDHQSKLTSEQADPVIGGLVTRTAPLSSTYSGRYSTWISASATYKGHTKLVDNLLLELSSLKIKQWDIQIQGQHLEGTAEYMMILPKRRIPFQNGTKDGQLSEVEALAERLLAYPALSATQTDVDTFAIAMRTARDNQQQKEQLVSMASDMLEQARLALCTMMYGNLGVLMDKYRDTPNMIENFWQLDLIRNTGQGGNDDDLPNTGVSIKGKVTDKSTGLALVGAKVSVYDTANGPGSGTIDSFTDAQGEYIIEISDLPAPMQATIEASHAGHGTESRNLALSPGGSYASEHFSLSPMP